MKCLTRRSVVARFRDARGFIFGSNLFTVPVFSYWAQDERENEDENDEETKHRANDGAHNFAMWRRPAHELVSRY